MRSGPPLSDSFCSSKAHNPLGIFETELIFGRALGVFSGVARFLEVGLGKGPDLGGPLHGTQIFIAQRGSRVGENKRTSARLDMTPSSPSRADSLAGSGLPQ